jgi:hypothetical protein
MGLELLEQRLADRAVEQRVGLLEAGDQERQVEQRVFLDHADQARGRADHELLHAALQRRLHLRVGAELAAAVGVDVDAAASARLHQFGKALGRQALRVVVAGAVAELAGLRMGQAERGGGRERDDDLLEHACCLLVG